MERQPLSIPLNSRNFPPEEFYINYPKKEKKFMLLGVSNKEDLIPVSIDTEELVRAVTFGHIRQYIYTGADGDLYDICIYKDERGECHVYDIRHR